MAGHEAYKLLADARTGDSGLDATVPPAAVDPDDVVDLTDGDPDDELTTDPTRSAGTDDTDGNVQ